MTTRIPPQTGAGFLMKRGQRLKVTDPSGEQVSDLVSFAQADTKEWLSLGPEPGTTPTRST